MKRAASPWSSTAPSSPPSADDPEPNVASLCPRLKWTYERCFQQWYSHDFLTGRSSTLPCQDEYREYQQCVLSKLDGEVVKSLPPIDERRPGALEVEKATSSADSKPSPAARSPPQPT